MLDPRFCASWAREMTETLSEQFISNHKDIVVAAALQGLGILYAHDDDRAHDAIRHRKLRRVLADWSTTLPGLFLYHPSRQLPQPALRAFIDLRRRR